MIQHRRATIDDLYAVEGPAELVGGRIVRDMTGARPGEVASNIYVSLRAYAKHTGRGKAVADNVGYVARVEATDRDSFCPDASYHTHPPAANPMKFIVGKTQRLLFCRYQGRLGRRSDQRDCKHLSGR
jgi:hypothetical protein